MGIIGDAFDAIGDFLGDVWEGITDFAGDIFDFIISPFGAFDVPDTPDPGEQAQGVTVTKAGTNVALPVVYGYRRVGGNIIWAASQDDRNKYLWVAYAICEGEIRGVTRILVDDVSLPLVNDGGTHTPGQLYEPTDGRFGGRIQYQIFNGSETQTRSTLAEKVGIWSQKRRNLPGVAYAVFRFEWREINNREDADANPYKGGIPQVKFDVAGKTVYDLGNHAGGLDLANDYANLPKAFDGYRTASEDHWIGYNPANCLLDYLMNPRYGCGIPKEQIDADSFKIAAEKFYQKITYSNTQQGPAMTMNAVLDTKAKLLDNVKILVSGNRGIMPFTKGRYKLKIEDGGHPTDIDSSVVTVQYDVTREHIVGGITLGGERKDAKYNQVIVNYIDPDKEFTNQQVVYNVSGDQTIDNDEQLTGEFTFHTVSNINIASDLAQMIYAKSRRQKSVKFTATQELLDAEVGDIIRITEPVVDLDLDTFRIVNMRLKRNGTVEIEATEHDATIYPFIKGPQIELPPQNYQPDIFTLKPYVRQLPAAPYGLFPPFITVGDSAGDGFLNQVLDDLIENIRKIVGVTDFDNHRIPYVPATNQLPYGTTADGKVYIRGYIVDPYTVFYYDAAGKTSLAQYTNPDYYTFDVYPAEYYHMVRPYTGLGEGKFQFDVIMPTEDLLDTLVWRAYDGGVQVAEYVWDTMDGSNPTGTVASIRNPNVRTRTDPYTGVLRVRYPIVYDFTQTQESWRWTVRWRNRQTGNEYRDAADMSDAGFTNYAYDNHLGQQVRLGGMEGFLNYVQLRYWFKKKLAAETDSFDKSVLTAILNRRAG